MKVNLPAFVEEILNKFLKVGHEIYIVGGAVRDVLMKQEVHDWDFTTNATPEIILGLFPSGFYDNLFGTVGVVNPQDEKKKKPDVKIPVYEITTFRKETGYSDARHPDKVSWGKTLQEDLIRRDFTIDAMALCPLVKNSGQTLTFKLIDPHHGQEDMKKKIIRAVGNPEERFQEDALRLMRAIRIATQLGFSIEEKTFQAIKNNVKLLDKISAERVRDELLKLFSYPFAADGYLLLRNSALAEKILPEVENGFGVQQKSPGRHHILDVGNHSLESLRASKTTDPIVNLAILLHDVGKPTVARVQKDGVITFYNHEMVSASLARNIAKRLKLSKKQEEKLVTLVRWHQFSVDEKQTDKAIRRFIRNVGKENIRDMLQLRTADRLGGGARETSWRMELFKKKLIEVQKEPFLITDLKIDGNEVMKTLKIHPGPLVGRLLNQLFEEVVDKKLKNEKTVLLKRLKQIAKKLV
ncbi:HD domain-containing protein [Patescibacteria group bacterium]|nr:HD domain-containing protein [Patescibacteria group bacterium]